MYQRLGQMVGREALRRVRPRFQERFRRWNRVDVRDDLRYETDVLVDVGGDREYHFRVVRRVVLRVNEIVEEAEKVEDCEEVLLEKSCSEPSRWAPENDELLCV
jgi:hypothetical protein